MLASGDSTGEVFSRVLFPVDLSTGVVATTTCSLTTCLTTCMGVPYMREMRRVGCPVYAGNEEGGVSRICGENPPESSAPVENFTVVRRAGSSSAAFLGSGTKEILAPIKAREGALYGGTADLVRLAC